MCLSNVTQACTNLLYFPSFTQAQSLCLSNVTQAYQSLVFLKLHPGPVSVSLKCDPSLPISCVSQASPRPSLCVSQMWPKPTNLLCVSQASPWPNLCVSQMWPKPTNLLCFSSFTQAQSLSLLNVTQAHQSLVFLKLHPRPVSLSLKCSPNPVSSVSPI